MFSAQTVSNGAFEKVFTGECFGIGLRRRRPKESHVEFVVLVEDDGQWFISSGVGSSFWMDELREAIEDAMLWVQNNCDPDPSGFGWVFR